MQSLLDVFVKVLNELERQSIDYMVVGSVASMIYGEPRLTKDMDVVLEASPDFISKIEESFPQREYYCPPSEVVSQEAVSMGQFSLFHHKSGLKIDIIVRKNNAHSQEEFSRRRRMPFVEGVEVFVASPEDVIIKKLIYFKEGRFDKHLTDIRGILANTKVDQAYLDRWVADLSLSDVWDQI